MHRFERKEREKAKKKCLSDLLIFASRDTAKETIIGNHALTLWSTLNSLADIGFTVLGDHNQFVIDTNCGVIELDCLTWELSFDSISFEDYFASRIHEISCSVVEQETHKDPNFMSALAQ